MSQSELQAEVMNEIIKEKKRSSRQVEESEANRETAKFNETAFTVHEEEQD